MTSREFIFKRLEELHDFYRQNFRRHWSSYVRKTLGPTCEDALKPCYRKRRRYSMPIIEKLEQHAGSLGFRPTLTSESPPGPMDRLRCPVCTSPIRVILTRTA